MKFLIIQTAFIGDVVLATPLIEKIKEHYPEASIDFLVRKGNEPLFHHHPHLRRVLIFDKGNGKFLNLLAMIRTIRRERYDYVINVQRFFVSGLMTVLSGAKQTIGFNKNPLSFLFSASVRHHISAFETNHHEVKRNISLIEALTDPSMVKPRLYPSAADYKKVLPIGPHICIAPASVWLTKQFPSRKWIELINTLPQSFTIYLMGAKADLPMCEEIKQKSSHPHIEILAGQLSFLESAALMRRARMNYVNDSAPLHFATAVNAPVSALYCSTIPAFGFGPLSDISHVFETSEKLSCRPCGLHGHQSCPEGHFKCANIDIPSMVNKI